MASRLHVRSVATADNLFGDTSTVPQSFKYKTFSLQNVQFSEKYLHIIFFTFICDYKTIPHISEKLLYSVKRGSMNP